jgi:hypothetical protein
MYAGNPDAIPFQANLHDGTTQIADNGQLASIASKPLYVLFTGSRTAVDQWSMTPVTDDIALRLLRKAYRRAFGFPDTLYDDDCELANDLAHELKKSTVVVDDIRTTNQISARMETIQRLEEADAADSQKRFVDALARFMGREVYHRDLLGHEIKERNRNLERIANAFAEAVGDRNSEWIEEYANQLINYRIRPFNPPHLEAIELRDAIEDVRNDAHHAVQSDGIVNAELRSVVHQRIVSFLDAIDPRRDREAERAEAAEQLFEVYRSWPEQSKLIGVRHREASSYRVDDHKVLTSNHSKIVLPSEIEKEGEKFSRKLHDGNLDYVDLGRNFTYLLTLDRQEPGLSGYNVRVELRHDEENPIKALDIPIWDHIEAVEVQSKLEKVFPGRFIASGGPLSVNSPISISYVGESKVEKDGKPELKLSMLCPSSPNPPLMSVVPLHRYMKVTPLVAEVRRQVKEVEDDLEKIKGGWLHWSCDKHDVPKNACYAASWKDCGRKMYVWVCPEERKAFEEFTIKILNFSNLIKEVKFSGSSGVKYSPATSSPPIR